MTKVHFYNLATGAKSAPTDMNLTETHFNQRTYNDTYMVPAAHVAIEKDDGIQWLWRKNPNGFWEVGDHMVTLMDELTPVQSVMEAHNIAPMPHPSAKTSSYIRPFVLNFYNERRSHLPWPVDVNYSEAARWSFTHNEVHFNWMPHVFAYSMHIVDQNEKYYSNFLYGLTPDSQWLCPLPIRTKAHYNHLIPDKEKDEPGDPVTLAWVEKALKKWKGRYSYENAKYHAEKTPIKIWCPKHQHMFTQRPDNHMSGHVGCCYCKTNINNERPPLDDYSFLMETKGQWLPFGMKKYAPWEARQSARCSRHPAAYTEAKAKEFADSEKAQCPYCWNNKTSRGEFRAKLAINDGYADNKKATDEVDQVRRMMKTHSFFLWHLIKNIHENSHQRQQSLDALSHLDIRIPSPLDRS